MSMLTERQKLTWTPRLRCMPEHSRHMKVPYVTLAHEGFLAGQSKQMRSLCRALIFLNTSSRTLIGTSESGSGTADMVAALREARGAACKFGSACNLQCQPNAKWAIRPAMRAGRVAFGDSTPPIV